MAFSALSIAQSVKAVVSNLISAPSLIQTVDLDAALDLSSAANEGKHGMILNLDCGGAGRAVTLPTAATYHGLLLLITNQSDAAESLTVSTPTATVINQNEAALFWNNAGTWTRPFGFSVVVDQSA